jgi:hypothetical protein
MVRLKKMKASTLVESLVAMVIITVSMGFALLILSNISGKSNPLLKFKAYTEAQLVINTTRISNYINNEEWLKEGLTVEKFILPYKDYAGLRILEVKIYDNRHKLLIHRKEIIRIPE